MGDLENIRENLYTEVGNAVGRLRPGHMKGETWSQSEMTKRITKYLMKGFELDDMSSDASWEDIVRAIVEKALFTAYCGVASEKKWFFHLDLTVPLSNGVYDFLSSECNMRLGDRQVKSLVRELFLSALDRAYLDKEMWTVCDHMVKNDEKVRGKLYGALQKTYWEAFDETVKVFEIKHGEQKIFPQKAADRGNKRYRRNNEEIEQIQAEMLEQFVRKWMDSSMGRFWGMANGGSPDSIVTEEFITELFRALMMPRGEDDAYTCFPSSLFEDAGRPPSHWPFFEEMAAEMVRNWTGDNENTSSKKRKKAAAADFDDEQEMNGQPDADEMLDQLEQTGKELNDNDDGWQSEEEEEPMTLDFGEEAALNDDFDFGEAPKASVSDKRSTFGGKGGHMALGNNGNARGAAGKARMAISR